MAGRGERQLQVMPRKFWENRKKLWNPITGWLEYPRNDSRNARMKRRED